MADKFASLTPAQQEVLLNGPAMKPPDVLSLGAALSLIAVLIRIYVKLFCVKKMRLEDYFIIAALAVFGAYEYYVYNIVIFPGIYVHQWNIRLKDMAGVLYHINAGSTVYGNVIMLLKIAILLEWIHLFVPRSVRNGFFWTCHFTLWLNVLFYVICTFLEIFGCQPRERLWNKLLPGKCLNMNAIILASAVTNLISDVIILILPQRIIWSLHLSTRKKLGISTIFAIGIFACICALLRMIATIHLLNSEDATYHISPVGLWCVGEMTAGFVIISTPSIPKALKNTPVVQTWISIFKSWTNLSTRKSKSSEPKGRTFSWRQRSEVRKPQDTGWSELSEHDLLPIHHVPNEPNLRDTESAGPLKFPSPVRHGSR